MFSVFGYSDLNRGINQSNLAYDACLPQTHSATLHDLLQPLLNSINKYEIASNSIKIKN